MRRLLILAVLYAFSNSTILLADDTFFTLNGGSLSLSGNQSTNISLDREIIYFSFFDDYYSIAVDFYFYNHGDDQTLNIGFPIEQEGLHGEGRIFDFECWTNGTPEYFQEVSLEKKWSKTQNIDYAYLRKIFFPKNKITNTKISYNSEYGHYSSSKMATYLFGTGQKWYKNIGNIQLVITSSPYLRIDDIQIGNESKSRSIDIPVSYRNDQIFLNIDNIEPKIDDKFYITFGDLLREDWVDKYPSLYTYDKKPPSLDLIKYYTASQLRILRNSIYAIHGYSFKSNDLIEFYGKRKWYKKSTDFSENMLNDVEKQTIKLFVEIEKYRK